MYRNKDVERVRKENEGKPIPLYQTQNVAYREGFSPPHGIVVRFVLNTGGINYERYGVTCSMGGFPPHGQWTNTIVEFARGMEKRKIYFETEIDNWYPLECFEDIPEGVRRDILLAEDIRKWEALSVFPENKEMKEFFSKN